MGLDLVEIIMEVEDAFGVKIEDEDLTMPPMEEGAAPGYRTRVGDWYQLILEKRKALALPKGRIRPEVLAMRDVRLALAAVLHASPEDFRPRDRLGRLLPPEDRRRLWRRLRRRLQGLGPLRSRKTRFRYVWWVAFLLIAAAPVWGLSHFGVVPAGGYLWGIVWPVLYLVGLALAAVGAATISDFWMANLIPKEARTVESLAQTHLARNRRYYIDQCGAADSDDDIWHTFQVILVDILGVEIGQVTKQADLVRDLGAD